MGVKSESQVRYDLRAYEYPLDFLRGRHGAREIPQASLRRMSNHESVLAHLPGSLFCYTRCRRHGDNNEVHLSSSERETVLGCVAEQVATDLLRLWVK